MLCTNCKKEKAVFFYSQTINGRDNSVALCKDCSAKFKNPSENFGIFEPFFKAASASPSYKPLKKCNLCGLGFDDIKKLGKVGCPECYNTFSTELAGIIRQIHGSAKHCGSTPESFISAPKIAKSEEEVLREKLSDAVKAENYEEAALLRDRIKALRGE